MEGRSIPGHDGIYYLISDAAEELGVSPATMRRIVGKSWPKYQKILEERGTETQSDELVTNNLTGYRFISQSLLEKLSSIMYEDSLGRE